MTVPAWALVSNVPDLADFSDAEFLQSLAWDKGAPRAVRDAASAGEPGPFLKAWRDYAGPATGGRKLSGWACLWSQASWPDDVDPGRLLQAAIPTVKPSAKARKGAIKAAADWPRRLAPLLDRLTSHAAKAHAAARTMGAESAATTDAAGPLTILAAAELWAIRGGSLPAGPAFALWRGLLTALRAALSTPVDETAPLDMQLVRQGELPFLAGAFFPGLTGSSALLRDGKKYLARKLSDHTDSDGTPHAELLPRLPLWLAPLVRATWWSELADVSLWNGDQQILLRETIEHATPLCRLDGRLAMGNGLAIDAFPLLNAAAAILGLSTDQPAAGYLKAIAKASAGKVVKSRPAMTEADVPSTQSDWARFALLRTDWSPQADTLAITHHQRFPQMDVAALGQPLLHGDWPLQLQIGDSLFELADEWSCVCWVSDADVDYLELQMEGPGNLRVERMVLLSRRDHFLLLADSIAGAPAEKITLRSQFPLAAGVTAQADTATREIRLQAGRQKVRAFPLGLACERVQSTPHTFAVADDQLLLEQVAAGTGLVAPVVFQWSPELVKKEAVWRTLTVSEAGKVAPAGTAAGFRLRIGDSQWLVYRSLKKPKEARTVLGHHSWNETVIGRFDKNGDLDPMLMVE
ncbi:hypothetical protein [Planctellipticum variicoloris]|uniref:hypothetical protein n=1 Tax=Planctellipticum variicoloris TaxID=3064265 RepID=UPI003013BDB6|nr:hypothetical protein SH412_005690 [Planctomycetaceae bacterium SH412]